MLTGFNTNIRHRGLLFHVQTEDSGRTNPHVITHLFHGGNIMASVKGDYREKLDVQDLEEVVRTLMEGQHKEMLKRLRRGEFDGAIEQRMGSDPWGDPSDTAATLPPGGEPPAPAAADVADTPKDRLDRAFGESVVSQKPLDEVVLDYLVANARKRKRSSR